MLTTFRDLPLGIKLGCLGFALCAFVVAGLSLFASTYAPIAERSRAEAHAHTLAAAAAKAFEQWTLDDDQSNMFAALVALRHTSHDKLAQVTLAQALDARKAVDPQLAAVDAATTDDQARALLGQIRRGLAAYDVYTARMQTYAERGDVDGTIRVVTVDNSKASDALTSAFEALGKRAGELAGNANHDIDAIAALGAQRMLQIVGLMIVVTGLLLTVFALSLTRPLRQLTCAARKLAEGDVSVEAELPAAGRDELGTLSESFSAMVQNMCNAAQAAEAVAAGDLRQTRLSRGERDRLGQAIESMVDDLRQLVAAVAGCAAKITGSADDLSGAAVALNGATSNIGVAIGHVTAGVEEQRSNAVVVLAELGEFSGHVLALSDATQAQESDVAELKHAFRDALAASIASTEQMGSAVLLGAERLIALREQSAQVGEIVTSIDTIADQTKLLALNAAIEAARAGEHGRGFAVVAQEISKLAESVAAETRKIAAQVDAMMLQVDGVGKVMEKSKTAVALTAEMGARARASLDAIVGVAAVTNAPAQTIEEVVLRIAQSITLVGETTLRVAATAQTSRQAINAVQRGTDAVSSAIERIGHVTDQTAHSADQVRDLAIDQTQSVTHLSESATTLLELAGNLHKTVSRFRMEDSASARSPRIAAGTRDVLTGERAAR